MAQGMYLNIFSHFPPSPLLPPLLSLSLWLSLLSLGPDLVLLFLDFEKTFDKIEWGFLFLTLSKLGFCPIWIQWISSLYQLVSSSIEENREPREDFKLVRSVRQGCPLAPYLFILAMDVLGHMLDDPKHEIEGLHLPKGDASGIKLLWITSQFTLKVPRVT